MQVSTNSRNLPAGEYTLIIRIPGFSTAGQSQILLLEGEQKRMPDVTLIIGAGCGGSQPRSSSAFYRGGGRLERKRDPAFDNVEVTLICRTFQRLRFNQDGFQRHFSFDMLSAGSTD